MRQFIAKNGYTTFLGLVVAGLLTLFTLQVKALITEKLREYVPETKFEDYIKAHQTWSEEVIKRLEKTRDDDVRAIEGLRDEIKNLRIELRMNGHYENLQ